MASTFAELYSDFLDQIKIYTEKLDVTELQFMRELTKGMQEFQKRVEYIHAYADLTRVDDDVPFTLPTDLVRIIELKDSDSNIILGQGFQQFNRNRERYATNKVVTPTKYSIPVTRNNDRGLVRMYQVFNRDLQLYPDMGDTALQCWFVPDLHPISRASAQWEEWFDLPDSFGDRFRNNTVNIHLAPFENAFVNYALASYIRSHGSANYKIFESYFKKEVDHAIMEKPLYNREMFRDYHIAPYS